MKRVKINHFSSNVPYARGGIQHVTLTLPATVRVEVVLYSVTWHRMVRARYGDIAANDPIVAVTALDGYFFARGIK